MESESEAIEVCDYLCREERPDIRGIAMEYTLGLTGHDGGRLFIGTHTKYLEAIIKLTEDPEKTIVKDAYFALVNMSAVEKFSKTILSLKSSSNFPAQLLRYILKPDSEFADIVCSLMGNLSRSEIGAETFVKVMDSKPEEIGFERVIGVFCKKDFNKKANFHYLGPFLSNLTQTHTARQHILDHENCVIQRLLPYTSYSDSTVRRGGVVAILKNCCFDTDHLEWLLSDEVNLLPYLLLPLAGGEEFDEEDNEKLPDELQYLEPSKQREEDPDIRRMLVEAINQMCATAVPRKYVRDKNTYIILRELHKSEKDPAANYAIENLISLLIGDEPAPGSENLKEVQIPEHIEKKMDKAYEQAQKDIEEETKKLALEEKNAASSNDVK